MGLYTPTILGGNSYVSWFYDTGAIKDPAHTGTSKGLSQATLKKKFVSCPAGGNNNGQSGGRKKKFFYINFFPLYRNGRENAGKKKKNREM